MDCMLKCSLCVYMPLCQNLFALTYPQPFARHSVQNRPLLPYTLISAQSHENLVNNDSTRLPLLPPRHFALSLCTKQKWESFWKSSWKNVLPVIKIDLFNDSDNNEWFSGVCAEDIMLRVTVAASEFDVDEVSSVHTSDWSNWQQRWCRDPNRWSRRTRPVDNRFTVRTRINTDLDVADASKLDLFYRLFTSEMFCYNIWANEPVCSRNDLSSAKPALQEVNKQPCCAQQRVDIEPMLHTLSKQRRVWSNTVTFCLQRGFGLRGDVLMTELCNTCHTQLEVTAHIGTQHEQTRQNLSHTNSQVEKQFLSIRQYLLSLHDFHGIFCTGLHPSTCQKCVSGHKTRFHRESCHHCFATMSATACSCHYSPCDWGIIQPRLAAQVSVNFPL